jgi:hypothetical protein
MPHIKYLCYLAITGAVLLDLYAANPATGQFARMVLDVAALFFAIGGLAGLAMRGESRGR